MSEAVWPKAMHLFKCIETFCQVPFQKCNVNLDYHQRGVEMTVTQPGTFQAADAPSAYVSTLGPMELSLLSQTGPISFSLAHPLHEGHPTIRELITGHKNVLCMCLASSINCSVMIRVESCSPL